MKRRWNRKKQRGEGLWHRAGTEMPFGPLGERTVPHEVLRSLRGFTREGLVL